MDIAQYRVARRSSVAGCRSTSYLSHPECFKDRSCCTGSILLGKRLGNSYQKNKLRAKMGYHGKQIEGQ